MSRPSAEPRVRSSAVDSRTGAKVAIKKLYRPFQSELYAKRAYRELRLLKHMRHENVSAACAPAPPRPAPASPSRRPLRHPPWGAELMSETDSLLLQASPWKGLGTHPALQLRPLEGGWPRCHPKSCSWKGHFASPPASRSPCPGAFPSPPCPSEAHCAPLHCRAALGRQSWAWNGVVILPCHLRAVGSPVMEGCGKLVWGGRWTQ